MSISVQTFFDRIARDFMAGDLAGMAGSYSFPCPLILADGRPVVVADGARFVETFAPIRQDLLDRGLLAVTACIGATEIIRGQRFRVWLRWHFQFPDRVETTPTDSIYYLSLWLGGRAIIEMAECDVVGQMALAA